MPTLTQAAQRLAQEMSELSLQAGVVHFVISKPNGQLPAPKPLKRCLKISSPKKEESKSAVGSVSIVPQKPAVKLINGRARINSGAHKLPKMADILSSAAQAAQDASEYQLEAATDFVDTAADDSDTE